MTLMDDDPWRRLIEAFAGGLMDGPTFERRFLALRRAEVDRGESQRYAVDLLFYEVDALLRRSGASGAGRHR